MSGIGGETIWKEFKGAESTLEERFCKEIADYLWL